MNESSYSVLLVEDEISIREGIRDIIEWEKLGYRFIGEAKNGKEALEIYDGSDPDLVITDIHMPKMNGLDFISEIRGRSKDTKIVILTGFDEFEYARRALKLNVRDYLLKPIAPKELSDLLKRVKQELDDVVSFRSDKGMDSFRPESQGLKRRLSMLKIISGISDPQRVENLKEGDDLLVSAGCFQVLVYDFDNSPRSINPDIYRGRFRQLNPPDVYNELLPDASGQLIEILFSLNSSISLDDISDSVLSKRKFIGEETKLSLSAGIGTMVANFSEIRKSYLSAQNGLSRRYIHGGNANYQAAELPDNDAAVKNTKGIVKFLKAVESASIDEWEEKLYGIVEGLKASSASKEHSQEIMTLAISAMLNELRKLVANFLVEEVTKSHILRKALSYKTIDSLMNWLKDLLPEIRTEVLAQRLDSSFTMANAASKYIESHYMISSLSFEEICRELGVSQSTLSRLFKTFFDTNFSSQLRDVRIRAAKKLLRQTDLRNKEIAYQVGFNSPHYFSHVFTKGVGYSPSEYRRKINSE